MTDSPIDLKLRVNGRTLRARWFAPRRSPGDPVIVLLHQGLGSVTQWRNFPAALAAATNCAVLAYDRFGHGESEALDGPRADDFFTQESERALPDLLRTLEIERPILYGHSDGGTIALLYAAAFPERVRAVISEAAHVFSEVDTSAGVGEVVVQFEQGDLRARLARHHGDKVESMFYGWADYWRDERRRDWRITEKLGTIGCPVLVIQGDTDEHGTLAQVEAIQAAVGGRAETFVLAGIRHMPHLEATEQVASRVARFLSGV
jgi:pimeloyl-ACP methyl ester carboxylesterase